MGFNTVEFESKLQHFGNIKYIISNDQLVEFVVENINYMYSVSNFGQFVINEIMPYYPNIFVLSMDKIRLKGVFHT
jgi:hypothetical protein